MPEIPLSDAGELAGLVARAGEEHDPVWLTDEGRRVAAVVDAARLEHLLRLVAQAGADRGGPFEGRDEADLGL